MFFSPNYLKFRLTKPFSRTQQPSIFRLIGLVTLALVLQACQGSNMPDLEEFVATAYKNKQPEIEPLPEIVPYKGFTYSADAEPDPFNTKNIATSRAEVAASGTGPNTNRRREHLESFPLDALRMVGTMTQQTTPWVIVQTTEGKAFRAKVGNYLGQNDGQIMQIIPQEQKVVLAELVLDAAGLWVTREVEITIDE